MIAPNITIFKVRRPEKRIRLDSARAVAETLSEYADASREMMISLYVNVKNILLHNELHAIGSVSTSLVSPRDIIKLAILNDATGIILVHNHPSGDTEPSPLDRDITKVMNAACALFGIEFLDHIILGEACYYSFRDHGELMFLGVGDAIPGNH